MISVTQRRNCTVISFSGELNSMTAPEADAAIAAVCKEGCMALIFDFAELTYLSSAGLRSILIGAKDMRERNGRFAVANASEKIQRVFQLSGLARHFASFASIEAAEASFTGEVPAC